MSVTDDRDGPGEKVRLTAPAKLTTSLRIVGVRADGYHLLDAEMVTLDLADTLEIDRVDDDEVRVDVRWDEQDPHASWPDHGQVPGGDSNLVTRALRAVGRGARVRVVKRIPVGAGLGGGSADAAAVLRWAGCRDATVAAQLGADVPFCLVGGRASVRGIGEDVVPLPHEDRDVVLLLAPFGVDTAAAYRAYDELQGGWPIDRHADDAAVNDLEPAALVVEPRLARWRDALEEATGRPARLAGSGSTWFVEGSLASLSVDDPVLRVAGETGRLIDARTVPAPG